MEDVDERLCCGRPSRVAFTPARTPLAVVKKPELVRKRERRRAECAREHSRARKLAVWREEDGEEDREEEKGEEEKRGEKDREEEKGEEEKKGEKDREEDKEGGGREHVVWSSTRTFPVQPTDETESEGKEDAVLEVTVQPAWGELIDYPDPEPSPSSSERTTWTWIGSVWKRIGAVWRSGGAWRTAEATAHRGS